MDWSKFNLAKTGSLYLHGVPVFKDEPRMPVQAVLDNLEDGLTPKEIASAYRINLKLVTAVRDFVECERLAHPVR